MTDSIVPRCKQPIYHAFKRMKTRCFCKTSSDYRYYGARGITVCDRWRDDYDAFAADMGDRPPGYTLDRIDNDGNYTPDNCRWASRKIQARNQGLRKDNTSGHRGIQKALWKGKWAGKWKVMIQVNGKNMGAGTHATLGEAIAARKAAEDKYWHGKET